MYEQSNGDSGNRIRVAHLRLRLLRIAQLLLAVTINNSALTSLTIHTSNPTFSPMMNDSSQD